MVIYGMVDAVLFGVGAVAVLALAPDQQWKYLFPVVIVASLVFAAPLSWIVASRLRAMHPHKIAASLQSR